jgi:hypothetical protein
MTEAAQGDRRMIEELGHEDLQGLLAYHEDRSYRQARLERSAQLMWLATWCREVLEELGGIAVQRIATLATRAGILSRGR